MSEEVEDFDTLSMTDLMCPYCGHVETDSWETPDNCTEGSCDSCGKDYKIEQEFSRTFSTYKTCQPGDEHTWAAWCTYLGKEDYRTCKLCGEREWKKHEQA